MYEPLPAPSARPVALPMWFWIAGLFLALVIVGFSTEAYSQERSPGARAGSGRDSIAWISGGVGSEGRDYMRSEAGNYNLHLTFSGRQGHYLANIPYAVQHQGLEIHSGVSDGPLLYLKLAPGTYVVSAELDGERQQKQITVGPGRRISIAIFTARRQ